MSLNFLTVKALRYAIAILLLINLTLGAAETQPVSSPDAPRPYPERIRWWADARFGMFIHWGPVSLKGTEISWSRANSNPKCPNNGPIPVEVYDNLYKEFNPTKFDAAQWVSIARLAGMRYMVLTAKHCDGFLLWDSRASDYNIMNSPFKRDICAELTKAAHEAGMRLGWYFSPMDWRDPDFRTEHNAVFVNRMQRELRELLGRYGTVDLLWFDWDAHEPLYDQPQTYRLVKTLQPGIVINNRLDLGPKPVGNPDAKSIGPQADYYTPEQQVGSFDIQHPWESCMTLSSRNQWAWGGPDDGVKSYETCMEMLIRCAGGDGNLLLNVGPMPTGEIPPDQVNRLKEMGAWLAKYGESIYSTRGGPFKPGDYGVSTRKGDTIYLHICGWTEGVLKLPPIPAKVLRSRVLTGGQVKVRQTAAGLDVSVPESDRQPLDTIVVLELDGPALAIPAVDVPTTTQSAVPSTQASTRVASSEEEGRENGERIVFDWLAFPDAPKFRVLGLHWFNENQPKLWRMPKAQVDKLPIGVNRRSRAPSGGRILIRCNTSNLALRGMPSSGGRLAGFDIYIDGKSFGYVVAERDAETEVVLFRGLDRKEKEIVIYLPSHQEIIIESVGVDPGTKFSPSEHKYAKPLPVVVYGSSVCQGTGASKPGMTYAAILGRDLNLDFVNLGFGGAGKAEQSVVDLVNAIPASCYVFDLGKSYGMQDKTAYKRMLLTVRDSHPGVPIICITPITSVREKQSEDYSRLSVHTRAVMREAVNDLLQAGATDLYLVEGPHLLGFDEHDALSKDGVHPSDRGFTLIARKLLPVLKRALGL